MCKKQISDKSQLKLFLKQIKKQLHNCVAVCTHELTVNLSFNFAGPLLFGNMRAFPAANENDCSPIPSSPRIWSTEEYSSDRSPRFRDEHFN